MKTQLLKMKCKNGPAAVFLLFLVWAGAASADVSLPHIFGDHMVLQRQKPVVVWGRADAGEKVAVQLGQAIASTDANTDGAWKVRLPALEVSAKPLTMIVKGANTITVKDILVGEVWLCSGQSNMEWSLGGAETGPQEIPKANFPAFRLFKINARPSPYPVRDVDADWRVCQPNNVSDFSAVGYFFGKYLHRKLDVPIGMVEAAWGGTRIEPWTPREGFAAQKSLSDIVKRIDQAETTYRKQLPEKIKAIKTWIQKTEEALENSQPPPRQPDWPRHPIYSSGHPTQPTCLYNSRIFPIVPFSLRGAIWYQGESNMGEGMLYYEKKKALINGWRTAWNDPKLSFYYVQLAPFRSYAADTLPFLWEAQTKTLTVPHTGMAVITDIGNVNDIHPRNKRDVGKRLALWALAKNYGQDNLVYSGPLYKDMQVNGGKIVISFDHTGDGLTTSDGKAPDWFEIAGNDKKFYPAAAKIVGNTIEVSSDKVPSPVAVRFAWDNIAEPNLQNKNGLPASSFRTDTW